MLQVLKAAIEKAKGSKVQESATAEAEKKLQELQQIADREAATAAVHAASEAADAKALQAAIEKAEACSVADKAMGESGRGRLGMNPLCDAIVGQPGPCWAICSSRDPGRN